ncbi:metal-sensitive transcriptional regulator [Leucobacter alluvii]|uniref:Metal-sensitive transcriptional regulator n=1 Tax=Leucobacter alluvii TaxID=340321 RepID=A0ABN3B2B4_9MICO
MGVQHHLLQFIPPGGIVHHVNGYEQNKDDLQKRLRRVEGQVRGIARMVDDDKYCIDILTQVSAATKALETVALSLLGDHLSHCVAEASAEGGQVAADKIREAQDAIARLVRS